MYPFRLQTGGSILAGDLAMKFGWAINIGGGFHHCSKHNGGGFCAYADITLLIKVGQNFIIDSYSRLWTSLQILNPSLMFNCSFQQTWL